MNRRGRLLAGLSLIGLGVLALDQPLLAAAFLVAVGLGTLAVAVRRRGGAQGAAGAAAAPHRIGRILVPVDLSPESARALAYARTLAERFRGQVFVLHVVPASRGFSGRRRAEEGRETRWRARVAMQAFLADAGGGAGCHVVFASGAPCAAILDEARRLGADLIVLGPRGTGDAEAAVLGRAAAKVVRRALVPVVTVAGAHAAAEGARPTVDRRPPTVEELAA